MRHFKSLEAISDAGVEELSGVPGMNRGAAQSVYDFFRQKEAQLAGEQGREADKQNIEIT